MREVKFRGKRNDGTGRWIEGGYSEYYDYKGNKFFQIRSNVGMHNGIIPETVGQFTGLQDKNGNDIYEGDIIKSVIKPKNEDVLEIIIGEVFFDENLFGYMFGNKNSNDDDERVEFGVCEGLSDSIERIGNIYDNPELLS